MIAEAATPGCDLAEKVLAKQIELRAGFDFHIALNSDLA
jgi:hypothetical protein